MTRRQVVFIRIEQLVDICPRPEPAFFVDWHCKLCPAAAGALGPHGRAGRRRHPPARRPPRPRWAKEEQVIMYDCEACVADQSIDGDLVHDVALDACPPWMSDQAASELADRLLAMLARVEGVTVVRGADSKPWTPEPVVEAHICREHAP